MKKIFIFFSVLSFMVLQAQQTDIDSLKYQLNLVHNDSVKFAIADNITGKLIQQKKYDSLPKYDLIALEQSFIIKDTFQMIRYSSEVGFDYTGNGDFHNALKYHKQALNLFYKYTKDTLNLREFDPYKFPLMTNNIGVVYAKLGVYDSAIHYMLHSIEEKQKLNVDESKLLPAWINLATLAFRKKDYSISIEFAEKSLDISTRLMDSANMAKSYNILGVVNKYENKFEDAIVYYKKSLELNKQTNNRRQLGSVYGNLGILYLELNDSVQAKKYIREALKYSASISDKSVLANTQSKMAFFYYDYMKYDSAILMARRSLANADQTGYGVMTELNYKVLHQSFAKLGAYDSAYLSALKYIEAYSRIYENESDKTYQELQTKYQTAEKEKEILELKYEAEIQKSQKIRMYWSIVVLAVVAGFIIFLIILKRRKDKIIYAKEQLVLKKEKDLADAELEKSKLQEQELKNEIQYKSKQLTTHALNMMQKNTLMQEIQEELADLSKKAKTENKAAFSRLKMLIKRNLRSEKDWDLFKLYFEDVNKDFYEELNKLSSELTSNDLKLCALLKLNMNIKESASVLNIEPASVKTARYKLRKKFGLQPDDDLIEYIRKIG